MNTIQINTGNTQIPAAVRADREQNRIESLVPQVRDIEVAAGGMVELQGYIAGLEDLAHLRLNDVARQTILGNAEIEHSAGNRRGFEDRDRISQQSQVMCGRKTDRPAADHRNLVGQSLAAATLARTDGVALIPGHAAR